MKRAVQVDVPPVSLDRSRSLPSQIADALRASIHSGRLTLRDRLPSTRAFARAIGVSRQVVVTAYEDLVATGHLHGRVGDGSYVAWTEPPWWVSGSPRVILDPDGYAIRVFIAR